MITAMIRYSATAVAYVTDYGKPCRVDMGNVGSNLMVPTGTSLDTFVVSPELERAPAESEKITFDGPIEMWVGLMEALGIPHELLAKNAKTLLNVSIRESDMLRARLYSE